MANARALSSARDGDAVATDAVGADDARARMLARFQAVRAETERRAAPLTPEDQCVQSMPDASPAKWHRAHTTWFFEQFVLGPNAPSYQVFDDRFAYLFNSYYVAAGPRHARPMRGLITRPDAQHVGAYRRHVDAAMQRLFATLASDALERVLTLVEIGLNHEQQHQELMLTDILHAFAHNPHPPAFDECWEPPRPQCRTGRFALPEGIHSIGHAGEGFSFDNEGPAHRELVGPVALSRALVGNGQWLDFMRDGGYATPSLWLSDGWAAREAQGWEAPGYWREVDGRWLAFTLGGLRAVDAAAPVCHVSYYEADAFARWSGAQLPSEAEWEVAARAGEIGDAFSLAWQWTRSAYSAYPGYRAAADALGEYNGKFMVNQMVLRGASLATPAGHARPTYRNFFQPPARWQFTGLRLAWPGQ
ncbi:MAG: ergothioneine biosynthesis protein EgtB [Proteobacteria bacterium]|nr:ergothioneine biosynthesis protein EgtB [Pseudomonadota bacterium]